MRNKISLRLGELDTKLNSSVAMLCFAYFNLCVKAEPVSLLPVVIKIDGEEYKIEEVAQVAMPEKNQLMVYPNDESVLFEIGKAIAMAHPEFDQDIVSADPDKASGDGLDDPDDDKAILLTMPKVDDDRHDALMDAVKVAFDEAKQRMDFHCGVCTAKITSQLLGAPAEELKEAKDALQELKDKYGELAQQYRDQKEKEIEEAYQLYLKQQQEKDRKTEEEQASTNEDAKTGFDISQFAGQ